VRCRHRLQVEHVGNWKAELNRSQQGTWGEIEEARNNNSEQACFQGQFVALIISAQIGTPVVQYTGIPRGGVKPPTRNYYEVLTKPSQIPSSMENRT
jgi:hypothetical protein